MEKATRRRYTLEYKQEAVGLVASGQRVSAAAKSLGEDVERQGSLVLARIRS